MTLASIKGVRIRAVSACVPQRCKRNADDPYISEQERELLIRTTGVEERRIAATGLTTADLCEVAARELLLDQEVDPHSIDIIVLVTQSGDYTLPASAIILQDRLGLRQDVMAFDVGLGCSGYVYGLSIVAGLMQSMGLRRGLLLAGDVSSVSCSPTDKSAYPLFGDAGSATLLEHDEAAAEMHFSLFSDGAGYQAIMIPDGGARHNFSESSLAAISVAPGVTRNRTQLALDGMAVFSFATSRVPKSIIEILNQQGLAAINIDYFVMHQANKIMNEAVRKKSGFSPEQTPYSLARFGNTSSASIPLTLVSSLAEVLLGRAVTLLLSGFGVGLSWGNALVQVGGLRCLPLIEVDDDGRKV